MENVIVASSNLYGLRALVEWPHSSIGHLLTSVAITCSLMYHLIERHKHSMPGAVGDGSWIEHQFCLNCDRAAALALALYLLHLQSWSSLEELGPLAAGALCLCGFSEMFHHFPQAATWLRINAHIERRWYVVTHSLWHLAAFHLVYLVAHVTNTTLAE